jgi:hypothetical protein
MPSVAHRPIDKLGWVEREDDFRTIGEGADSFRVMLIIKYKRKIRPTAVRIGGSRSAVPVTLNIRCGRIRSCREDAVGSRIAKRLVCDRRGFVPGVASASLLCGDAVVFAGV